MSGLPPSPGQTVGPFFGYALPYPGGEELVPPGHPGATRLHGTVYDGWGVPVPDALIEIWQPDPTGRIVAEPGSLNRDGYTFTGFGRSAADAVGHYQFTTLEPGPVGAAAPFFAVAVFARGLLDGLHTRIYLPGSEELLNTEPVFAAVEPSRLGTLVAVREADGSLRHDIRLQGEGETVFLDFG